MSVYEDKTCAMLDDLDPIARGTTFTSQTFRDQFLTTFPELWWCADTLSTITPRSHELYAEHSGDSILYQIIEAFNNARREWVIDYEPEGEDEIKQLDLFMTHIEKSSSTSAVEALVRHFKRLRTISSSELNKRKYLIGTPFGAVDLSDGLYIDDPDEHGEREVDFESIRDARITKSTTTFLYPNVENRYVCQEWLDFVDEIMCHDQELVSFLKRAFGYGLYGGNPEEVMFILYGPTSRNGKGVLMSAVEAAVGDYGETLSSAFLGKKNETDVTDAELASLVGVRMGFCSEPPKGMRFDDSKLKTLTGGDKVRCAAKFGAPFTYRPEYTIYLACNELPKIDDEAIFLSGRVLVIPFNRHFEPSEQNKDLKDYFIDDEDIQMSILEWLVEGHLEYLEQGLNPPAAVLGANLSYRETSQNGLERFLYEFADRTPNGRWEYGDFKEWYRAWRIANDYPEYISTHELKKQLSNKGLEIRKSNSKQWVMGVSEKSDHVGLESLEEMMNSAKRDDENSAKGTDSDGLVDLSDDDDEWWD